MLSSSTRAEKPIPRSASRVTGAGHPGHAASGGTVPVGKAVPQRMVHRRTARGDVPCVPFPHMEVRVSGVMGFAGCADPRLGHFACKIGQCPVQRASASGARPAARARFGAKRHGACRVQRASASGAETRGSAPIRGRRQGRVECSERQRAEPRPAARPRFGAKRQGRVECSERQRAEPRPAAGPRFGAERHGACRVAASVSERSRAALLCE